MDDSGPNIKLKTLYKPVGCIESLYTGGKVGRSAGGQFLYTTLGEDVLVHTMGESLEKIQTLKGDSELITTFALAPNGQCLVTASRSQQLSVWSLYSHKIERIFKAQCAPIIAMDIDSTSTLVATGSADGIVMVWDIKGGFCTHQFKGHTGLVSTLKFHPISDAKHCRLISGSSDSTVRVWDLIENTCVAVLKNHVGVVRGIALTANGEYLVSCSRDQTVSIWHLKTETLLHTVALYESVESIGLIENLADLCFQWTDPTSSATTASSLQAVIFTGGEKGAIRFWDLTSGNMLYTQPDRSSAVAGEHRISDLLYCPAVQQLLKVTTDQDLVTYQLPSVKAMEMETDAEMPLAQPLLRQVRETPGYNEEIIDGGFLGSGHDHVVLASNSEKIRVYNLGNLDCSLVEGHSDTVLCLDVHSSGLLFASGSKDSRARLWRLNLEAATTNQRITCLAECTGHTQAINALALAKRGDSLPAFMLTGGQDRTIKCWDLSELDKKSRKANRLLKPVTRYTFQAHDKDINSVAVAPNDKVFATGSQDKTAKVWSVADGTQLGTCSGHKRGVWRVEFSPVDQVLATSSSDKTIKLWSVTDFSCLRTFEGHTNSVISVKFVSAGLQLLSGGADGLLKLWTIKTNECVLTADHHDDKIWALAVNRDESKLLTGGGDSIARIWEDQTETQLNQLHEEQADALLKEQALTNCLQQQDYRQAITLALQLDKPYRLYSILTEVGSQRSHHDPANTSVLGASAVDQVIASLSMEQVARLLTFVREWNTNSKRAHIAQAVLNVVLNHYEPEKLLEVPGIRKSLDALIPYSERHYQRLDHLLTQSYIVDYTLHAMDTLLPLSDDMDTLP
ncbi:U3 small nucleolar RNA-associated protein [Dimargaris xerosporica]|nr:U3 small nucleolar RNA-associated protein [Dimargaris xerosporica]